MQPVGWPNQKNIEKNATTNVECIEKTSIANTKQQERERKEREREKRVRLLIIIRMMPLKFMFKHSETYLVCGDYS